MFVYYGILIVTNVRGFLKMAMTYRREKVEKVYDMIKNVREDIFIDNLKKEEKGITSKQERVAVDLALSTVLSIVRYEFDL